jgi:hypothetical protein
VRVRCSGITGSSLPPSACLHLPHAFLRSARCARETGGGEEEKGVSVFVAFVLLFYELDDALFFFFAGRVCWCNALL